MKVWDGTDVRCGEAPHWDAANQCLWWVDMYAGCFYRTANSGVTTTSDVIAPRISFAIPTSEGVLVGAERSVVLQADGGQCTTVLTLERHPPDVVINDGKLDRHGRLWFSTRVKRGSSRDAGLYAWDRAGTTAVRIRGGLTLGNGICWSRDATLLYNVETVAGRIEVHELDRLTGMPTAAPRTLVKMPSADGVPDGLTVDRDGCLWVAMFGGWSVHRYSPEGQLLERHRLPVRCPTSCAFGGADLLTLFVTTCGLGNRRTFENGAAAGRLLSFDVEVGGYG